MSHTINHQIGAPHHTAKSHASPQHDKKASKSDHAMYLGMMALIEGISQSEQVGTSLAELSKTLYDTIVKNGTNKIEEMQKELSALTYMQEHYSAFKNDVAPYQQWQRELSSAHAMEKSPNPNVKKLGQYLVSQLSGHPPLPPGTPSGVVKYMSTMGNFTTLSSMRTYVNDFAQQINSENNDVASNKQIPDALQNQVRMMSNDQTQYASEVTSFLRVMHDQLQFS